MTDRGRRQTPALKGHAIEIPVRFAECDSYRVVWHGYYALYLEQVREALTARFGFTAARALELGYRLPITRMEIRYFRPALADSILRVAARLRTPQAAKLLLDYEIRDSEGRLLAAAETEQVILNREGELLLTLPAAVRKLADQIVRYQDEL